MIIEIVLFIAVACGALYLWVREKYKYFERLGIEYWKPSFLVGSQKEVFFQKQNFFDSSEPMYKFGKSRLGFMVLISENVM